MAQSKIDRPAELLPISTFRKDLPRNVSDISVENPLYITRCSTPTKMPPQMLRMHAFPEPILNAPETINHLDRTPKPVQQTPF